MWKTTVIKVLCLLGDSDRCLILQPFWSSELAKNQILYQFILGSLWRTFSASLASCQAPAPPQPPSWKLTALLIPRLFLKHASKHIKKADLPLFCHSVQEMGAFLVLLILGWSGWLVGGELSKVFACHILWLLMHGTEGLAKCWVPEPHPIFEMNLYR